MTHHPPARVLFLTCLLSAVIAAAPSAACAQEAEPSQAPAFIGLRAALCTFVYSPLKIAFAASGLVVGSLAWMWSFGSVRVSRPVFTAALRGDYVVTPAHLTGRRRLEFRGRRY